MSGDRLAFGVVALLVLAGLARQGSRGTVRPGRRGWREAPEDWPEAGQRIRVAAGALHLLGWEEMNLESTKRE